MLYTVWYNFCRWYSTLKTTPAVAAGLAQYPQHIHWIVGLGSVDICIYSRYAKPIACNSTHREVPMTLDRSDKFRIHHRNLLGITHTGEMSTLPSRRARGSPEAPALKLRHYRFERLAIAPEALAPKVRASISDWQYHDAFEHELKPVASPRKRACISLVGRVVGSKPCSRQLMDSRFRGSDGRGATPSSQTEHRLN